MKQPSEELKRVYSGAVARIYTVALAQIDMLNKKCQAYTFGSEIYTVKELREDAEKLLEGLK